MDWSNATGFEEQWPGQHESRDRLRGTSSVSCQKTLRWAAVIVLLRLAVLPWIILFDGYKRTPFLKDEPMVISSVGLGFIFLLCASISRVSPVLAVLISLGAFGFWTNYDIQHAVTILDAGLTAKGILGVLLIWAFMQAVMSRTL